MNGIWTMPWHCFLNSLERLRIWKPKAIVFLTLGLLVGWWIYVPIHELLHAGGCLLAGGEVNELLIQPKYGGAFLERIIPFVKAGGHLAGQLTDFNAKGSDIIYGITILLPFLPGLGSYALLAYSSLKGFHFLFGLALPWALAPLFTLAGDMYELGSLMLLTTIPNFRLLVTDDLVSLLRESWSLFSSMDILFITAGVLNGLSIAYTLMLVSSLIAVRLCRRLK